MTKKTFAALTKAVDDQTVGDYRTGLTGAYDTRANFQRTKDAGNEKIQDCLKASHKALSSDAAVKVLVAAEVSSDFITRQTNEGSAYNVYAALKLADMVSALDSGVIGNAINNAVSRSLFAFKTAGEKFTGEMARAAASDKIRVQGQIGKLLVRHTVSASTAPTQMSSTMQALQTLGIVTNVGTRREPVFQLTETPQAKRLGEIVAKAA